MQQKARNRQRRRRENPQGLGNQVARTVQYFSLKGTLPAEGSDRKGIRGADVYQEAF
jgi:hypothetical protein